MTTRTAALRLQLIDAISGPAKGSSKALSGLEGSISKLGKGGMKGAKNLVNQLEHLRQKSAAVGRFSALRRGTAAAFGEFRSARANVKALEAALSSATKPTAKMASDLKTARAALTMTSAAFNQQRTAARNAETSLRTFGLNSRTAISTSQGEIRRQMALTISKMRQMRTEAAKPMPIRKQAIAASNRSGGYGFAGTAAGAYAAGAVIANPVRKALSYDERLTYLAGTMADDGSAADKQLAKQEASDAIQRAIQIGGGRRDDALAGLDTLVASGVMAKDAAMRVLPTVQKAAFASGANTEDIAKSVVAMIVNGVEQADIPFALDKMLRAGQSGGFELKDLSRWLPAQMALLRGSGMTGIDAVEYLSAANQTQLKTAGSTDEAANNLINVLQKLNSRELQKTMSDQVKARPGDPTLTDGGFDWQGYMIRRRQEGVAAPEALTEILNRQLEDDKRYQALLADARNAKTQSERIKNIDGATSIAEGSAFGALFADRQALFASIALQVYKSEQKAIEAKLATARGAVDVESQFVRSQTWSKTQDSSSALDLANEKTFDAVSGPLGSLAEKIAETSRAFPALTTAVYGIATTLGAVAGAGIVGGVVGGRLAGGRAGLLGAGGGATSRLVRTTRVLGPAAVIAGTGLDVYDAANDPKLTQAQKSERYTRAGTGAGGALAGAKAGAALGAYGGPWGAAIGGAAGGVGGYFVGDAVGEYLSGAFTSKDPTRAAGDQLAQETMKWHIAAQQGMRDYVHALAQGGDEAEAKAAVIAAEIERIMSFEANPTVATASLERALGLARQVAAVISGNPAVAAPPSGGGASIKVDGARAKGGPVRKGGVYRVNEEGEELFVPGTDGTIIPHGASLSSGRRSGGPVSVVNHNKFEINVYGGGDEKAAHRLAQIIEGKLSRSAQTLFGGLKFGDF
ncbi:phage tail tape measure protein [Pseudochrobactrum sp. sp1633]|uniref:phage tail tape measure protein n=1 Tax=Pseudochrobactrum sp. sp1633 TaxID=3036706 RepID=UPI0025A59E3B|nr:phage tail tape measure protein [Pseudochrobactrum sp. sp1633]MDM8344150.1 phage tail tape measure protein [Pseudochrobactrum sp. sp1633]